MSCITAPRSILLAAILAGACSTEPQGTATGGTSSTDSGGSGASSGSGSSTGTGSGSSSGSGSSTGTGSGSSTGTGSGSSTGTGSGSSSGSGSGSFGTVSTYAGTGVAGHGDGDRSSATFNQPAGIAVGTDGRVWIVERNAPNVRVIEADGQVSTVVPTGARLVDPSSLVIGQDGVLYISDTAGHCVIRMATTGAASAFAGQCGTKGETDGRSGAARFDQPRQIAVANDGTLLVADNLNHLVRAISLGGDVTTLAGEADQTGFADAALPARAYYPTSVAATADGFIVAGQDNCLRRTVAGRLERWAGLCQNYGNSDQVDGAGADARFDFPRAILGLADGSVLVSDGGNHAIRRVLTDGSVQTLGGSGVAGWVDGPLTGARFSTPGGLALLPDGTLLVADSANHRIRRLSP